MVTADISGNAKGKALWAHMKMRHFLFVSLLHHHLYPSVGQFCFSMGSMKQCSYLYYPQCRSALLINRAIGRQSDWLTVSLNEYLQHDRRVVLLWPLTYAQLITRYQKDDRAPSSAGVVLGGERWHALLATSICFTEQCTSWCVISASKMTESRGKPISFFICA